MAVDQPQRMATDLPNQFLEMPIGERPCFDFLDQVHGDIDRAGFLFLLEGQMPAGLGAAGTLELAQGSFQKRAELGDMAEGGSAEARMAVLRQRKTLHVLRSIYTYLITQAKKRTRGKKFYWSRESSLGINQEPQKDEAKFAGT
jgi:hypothetical protein